MKRLLILNLIMALMSNLAYAQEAPFDKASRASAKEPPKSIPAKKCSERDEAGEFMNEGRSCLLNKNSEATGICRRGVCNKRY